MTTINVYKNSKCFVFVFLYHKIDSFELFGLFVHYTAFIIPMNTLPACAEPKHREEDQTKEKRDDELNQPNISQKYELSQSVIADLEKKGYELITGKLNKEPVQDVGQKLMNFMQDGAKDFEQRTGRKMTYAEMRAAWG